MKRLFSILFVGFLCVFLTSGCGTIWHSIFPSPSEKANKAEQKVEQVKHDIDKKDDILIENGRGYLYGSLYSMSLDPFPSIYTTVAKSLGERAQIAIGSPEMAEIIQLREIVNNLVSSNKDLVIKGNKQLKDKDLEVVNLQQSINKLQDTLQVKEDKLKQINETNAGLADKFVKLKSIFWWIVWIVGIGFVLTLLGKVLPAPYSNIIYLLALPFGILIKGIHALIPQAKEVAGVVGKEYKDGLEKIVVSLEDTKANISAKNEATGKQSVGLEQLKTELNKNTDDKTKVLISQTKQNLGYI